MGAHFSTSGEMAGPLPERMARRGFVKKFASTATLASIAAALSAGSASAQQPWMNKSLSAEQRAHRLLRAMTLHDKIALVHGVRRKAYPFKGYAGYVPPNPRLRIPALRLADGRTGVGNGAKDVTLLPAPLAAAASWDTALMNAYGRVLGREEWEKGTNVFLGPTIDIARVPEWGRAFETYGEDPYLNAQMAVAEIRGVQSQGPIANANMYLTMNQETERFRANSVVDKRTLQEIYLPPFRAAIERGDVGTIMCAYVQTNGAYSCQNPRLLQGFLRSELAFQGWVLSDWGATHSTLAAARAGLDQEMPGGRYYGAPLEKAVEDGQVSMVVLNQHVLRILVTMFRHGLFDRRQQGNWQTNALSRSHDLFARKVAAQGTVLLKNKDNILPLSLGGSIAVVGADGGATPVVEGGGSSYVVPPYVVSPLEGIRRRAGKATHFRYTDGSNLAQAARIAGAVQTVIVFADAPESEGADRPNLDLPGDQDQLISAVAAANPNTVVVLNTGGAVLMPWLRQVRAVVEAWYPGQEDGNAIAGVLFGDVDPSGKLPLTFPPTEAEVPTATPQQWPGVNGRSIFSEKLEVGYRWYDARHIRPLFPFGYGLSYTSFRLSHLRIIPNQLRSSSEWASDPRSVVARLDVTNTGHRAGAEVVQAYVAQPAANGEPPRQLAAFAKVWLNPGETRLVKLNLNCRAFSYYDAATNHWISPPGQYRILIGTSSRDLPLESEILVEPRR